MTDPHKYPDASLLAVSAGSIDPDCTRHDTPFCPGCCQEAGNIASVCQFARENGMSPEEWVRHEEGTYNPRNEHFLCDNCFLNEEMARGGRLVGPDGKRWVCP